MTDRKIYVVGPAKGYASWMDGKLINKMEDADLVVFTGGEDINPALYGSPQHSTTHFNNRRDDFEVEEYYKALALQKPMIGICRGLQLLCALNGGLLVQHQQNKRTYHMMETFDGKTLEISSLHHQAAYPYNMKESDYKILGWTNGLSEFHKDGNDQEMNPEKECEMVLFPKTRSFGIQGHPEMLNDDHPTITYLKQLLTDFINNKL